MNRKLIFSCALIFLALFGVYMRSLNPAFRADDSPETIASCVTLGIQHPPAYPLHTMVGRLFSLPEIATAAWRVNMMAAFFGALCCAIAMAIVALWAGSISAGALSAVLLGLSPTFWSQSLAAKGGIYTFHATLLITLLWALTLWADDMTARFERPQSSRLRLTHSRYFLLAALLLFVGFANHWETQALFVPAALAWLFFFVKPLKIDAALPNGRALYAPLLKCFLLALAALSIYLYLPMRAGRHPVMNWGVPDTWKQFWWVLLRQEYLDIEVGFLKALKAALLGGGDWAAVAENWLVVKRQGLRVIRHLMFPGDLGLAGSALAALGIYTLVVKRRLRELAFTLGLIASFCFVVTFYFQLKVEMIWILDVFLIPSYIMQALLAGMGTAWLLEKLPKRSMLVEWAGLGLVFGVLAISRMPTLSQHDHFWAWDYGRNFLASLKRDAIVFAEGDFNTMPVYYLQNIKGERRDVTHITTIFASTQWGVEELKRNQPELGISIVPNVNPNLRVGDGNLLRGVLNEIVAKNSPRRPIHSSLFRQVQSENMPQLEAFMSPSGLSAEYKAPENAAQWLRRIHLPQCMVIRYLPDEMSRFEPSPEFALSNYGTLYMDLANYSRLHGLAKEAMPIYSRAVSVTTLPNRAEAYTHWGIALASMGQPDAALEKFSEAIKVKPLFEAYANQAGVMNQMKHYDQAEVAARQAIAVQPSSGQSWNNLAISLYYRGKQADAVQALETAIRFNPNDPTIAANLRALKGGK